MVTRAEVVHENLAVRALLRYAERHPHGEQRADPDPLAEVDVDDQDLMGLIIAAEHGVGPEVLGAYRGLARSRGVDLEQVIRAQLRGELRQVVELPTVSATAG